VNNHFRSKSWRLDVSRGFGNYIHLTTVNFPPILDAKLNGGFPHVCLSIPSADLGNVPYDLCRFNVAMSRYLRRDEKVGSPECERNGYYFDQKQIPIARTPEQQKALLERNKGSMIEVLREQDLYLTEHTSVSVFSASDREAVKEILDNFDCHWDVSLSNQRNYLPKEIYVEECQNFIAHSLENPLWKGNGLEFDKV
jgi:hypothetical protein